MVRVPIPVASCPDRLTKTVSKSARKERQTMTLGRFGSDLVSDAMFVVRQQQLPRRVNERRWPRSLRETARFSCCPSSSVVWGRATTLFSVRRGTKFGLSVRAFSTQMISRHSEHFRSDDSPRFISSFGPSQAMSVNSPFHATSFFIGPTVWLHCAEIMLTHYPTSVVLDAAVRIKLRTKTKPDSSPTTVSE